jgi:hypothetical protein
MRLFGQLTKIEEQPDGTLKVFGVASTGARDDEGEVVLPAAMKAALPDYARYPALREMHGASAAGRTLEATVDDEGATRIVAHVVDPVAIAKVKSRTYAGFSIGGRVLARDAADPTVITEIKLSEISLVDRPANPEAVIDLWKADIGPALPPPGNDAVKLRAGAMAAVAGRAGAWKDYVAKARAALLAEHAAVALAKAAVQGTEEDEVRQGGGQPGAQDPKNSDGGGADDAAPINSNDSASDDVPDEPSDDSNAGDDPQGFASRLAQLVAADPDARQALHDALAAHGAACDPANCPSMEKAVSTADLTKLQRSLAAAVCAKTEPRLARLERRLAHQDALIERLAATPLPPRTAASPHAHAIGKSDDADPDGPDDPTAADAQRAFAALTADERAFLLMKASLRLPIPLG